MILFNKIVAWLAGLLMPGKCISLKCPGIPIAKRIQGEPRHIAHGVFLISRLVAQDKSL